MAHVHIAMFPCKRHIQSPHVVLQNLILIVYVAARDLGLQAVQGYKERAQWINQSGFKGVQEFNDSSTLRSGSRSFLNPNPKRLYRDHGK